MTKKELSDLHNLKCVVQKTTYQSGRGEEQRLVVSFSLSLGELHALQQAIHDSPRGDDKSLLNHQKDDVEAFLNNGLIRAGLKD